MQDKWEEIKKDISVYSGKAVKLDWGKYVEFSDGTYFHFNQLLELKEEYDSMIKEMYVFIKKNNIDYKSVDGHKELYNEFPKYRKCFTFKRTIMDFDTFLYNKVRDKCNRLVIEL